LPSDQLERLNKLRELVNNPEIPIPNEIVMSN